MSEETGAAVPSALVTLYERLGRLSTEEKRSEIRSLIASDSSGRLHLPRVDGAVANFDGIDLGRSVEKSGERSQEAISLRDADLQGIRLREARLIGVDLHGALLGDAAMGGADLRRANLEKADLTGADLADADLRGAQCGGAIFRDAMLEESDLRRASLRFADLRVAALDDADLRRADFWGASLAGASLVKADARGAIFKEADLSLADLAGANLRGAALGKAVMRGTRLDGADLRGASIQGLDLRDASLRGTKLQGLDLSSCDLTHVSIGGAWLEKTRIGLEQLGGSIGEEVAGDYDAARKGYLTLERVFTDLGDPDAASWAYRRKRRMQKNDAARRAGIGFRTKKWTEACSSGFDFVSDQLVEWLCDYGESVARVMASMVVVFLVFTLIYGLTDSVTLITKDAAGAEIRKPTRSLADLAVFSLMAMTTSGNPAVALEPSNEFVHLLTGVQALIGIALTGLLGFVLGNLVRR